jgi:hypothetical protein
VHQFPPRSPRATEQTALRGRGSRAQMAVQAMAATGDRNGWHSGGRRRERVSHLIRPPISSRLGAALESSDEWIGNVEATPHANRAISHRDWGTRPPSAPPHRRTGTERATHNHGAKDPRDAPSDADTARARPLERGSRLRLKGGAKAGGADTKHSSGRLDEIGFRPPWNQGISGNEQQKPEPLLVRQ